MKKSLLLLLGGGSVLILVGMILLIAPSASVEAMVSPNTTVEEDCGDEAAGVELAHAGASTGMSLLLQATATPEPEDDGNDAEDRAAMAAENPGFYCLDCHSDAERLQLLAEEEEVVESLNEGSG